MVHVPEAPAGASRDDGKVGEAGADAATLASMNGNSDSDGDEDLEDVEAAADRGLISAMSGSITEMKALRDRCAAAGIPTVIGCPGGGPGGKKTCGPRTHLLVEEDMLPRLTALLREEWHEGLEREGLTPLEVVAPADTEHPPCPACGTAAALVDGACSDCGLQLE